MGYFRKMFVSRRKWLDENGYADLAAPRQVRLSRRQPGRIGPGGTLRVDCVIGPAKASIYSTTPAPS